MFELKVKGQVERVLLKDIPVLRQAFVLASVLILIGTILGIIIHPYFFALPLLVSGGLMFSGLVGWCPMAVLLGKLPCNK